MKKVLCILFACFTFILSSFFIIKNSIIYEVEDVISPVDIVLDKKEIKFSDIDSFDAEFTQKNLKYSKAMNISEEEAFIMGNLSKYWTSNLLKGRYVSLDKNSDIIYLKYSYKEKFLYSGFCIKDSKPFYKEGFEKILDNIRKSSYKIIDIDTDKVYEINDKQIRYLKNYLVIKNSYLPKTKKKNLNYNTSLPYEKIVTFGNIKVLFSDSTVKIKPDRKCETQMCREILNNINNSKESIDIAIYGYSRTPDIEKALEAAKNRGVKLRLVYDSNKNGGNIYPDTDIIKGLIPNNTSDRNSDEAQNIMHNKFYIFDNKILITGSANLSHTDMSDFNTNCMVIINSKEIANIYETEFEKMYKGYFHNAKPSQINPTVRLGESELSVYFSPQDKCIRNAIIPIINEAKKYIYIPAFVLTDRKISEALIKAKNRGVDIKIIIDALNASIKHSKHKELRSGQIPVKTENYAGKMHSKSIIVDDTYTIIGSMNFSYSGENKNDENLIIIKNSEIAKNYREFFMYQWEKIDNKWLKYNARAEGKDSIGSCTDGLDNNYDGLTDFQDPACK